jgi:pimeloyl-ACP methyl ester carboxylesterase
MIMKPLRSLLKLIAGFLTGYLFAQLAWVLWQLGKADPRFTLLVPANRAAKGISFEKREPRKEYSVRQVVEDGVERISYLPQKQRYKSPLLLQHGMFHSASCWQPWQELFAQWGWESHALSLPGHGTSPEQRPIRECTLDYYVGFLRDEAKRLRNQPVLIGHSMGGALIQWYLKYISQAPAAVFVASWVADSVFQDGLGLFLKQDPAIVPLMMRDWDARSWIRTPQRAAEKFLGPRVNLSPGEFQEQLYPESAVVLFQHNPPFWRPPEKLKTPSLWLAGEKDAVVSVPGLRRSARIFKGDFELIPGAGHNLMDEQDHHQTAVLIHDWLLARGIE